MTQSKPAHNAPVLHVVEHPNHLDLTFASSIHRDAVRDWFSTVDSSARRPEDRVIHFCRPREGGPMNYRLESGFAARLRRNIQEHDLPFFWEERTHASSPDVPFGQHLMCTEADDLESNQLILDDTQIAACNALLAARRGAIELGCGSGKTEVVLNAWQCLKAAGMVKRALYVVHTTPLRKQTVATIGKRLLSTTVGEIGGGTCDPNHEIVVATVQSACGREGLRHTDKIRDYLQKVDLLIIDEAHMGTSQQYRNLLGQCPAARVWAVSAKLTYQDEKNAAKQMALEGLFGPPKCLGSSPQRTCPTTVVFHRDDSWTNKFDRQNLPMDYVDKTRCRFLRLPGSVWEEGYYRGRMNNGGIPDICKVPNPDDIEEYGPDGPIYKREAMQVDPYGEPFGEVLRYNLARMIPDPSRYGVYVEKSGVWQQVEKPFQVIYQTLDDVALALFEERNQWALGLATTFAYRGEAFVITVRRKFHLALVHKLLEKAGLKTAQYHGELTAEERAGIEDDLRSPRLHGVVATDKTISVGLNVPNLRHLIKLDGLTDEQLLFQQLGRVRRTAPGKKRGYLHLPVDVQEHRLAARSAKIRDYFEVSGTITKELLFG